MSLVIAVFSARHNGQLLPPREYGFADDNLLHLISGSSPLYLICHTYLDNVGAYDLEEFLRSL